MTHYKLITRVCWARHGVREFTELVNAAFAAGWMPFYDSIQVEKRGLRIVCMAVLAKAVPERSSESVLP